MSDNARLRDTIDLVVRLNEETPARKVPKVLELVKAEMDTFQVKRETLIRDVMCLDRTLQIYEDMKVALYLSDTPSPSSAFPLLRRAVECLHDVSDLVQFHKDPMAFAAELWVEGLHSRAEVYHSLGNAGREAGVEVPPHRVPTVSKLLADAVEHLEEVSPPSAAAVKKAAGAFRIAKRKRKRRSRTSRFQTHLRSPEARPLATQLKAMWGNLSHLTHPHTRIGTAIKVKANGIEIQYDYDEQHDAVREQLYPVLAQTLICCRVLREEVGP